MTDEEVELVDLQQTDNDTHSGSGLNLQVLTFLLVAATFVWITGTPALQETTTHDWKKHDLNTGTVADFRAPAKDVTCTKSVEYDQRMMMYLATSDEAVCFERKAYRLKQLELYGHKLTYDKQPEWMAEFGTGVRYESILG